LSTPARRHSFGQLLGRIPVLLGVVVLVCVPGLTRMSQRLETASRTPSFAKNIDCPPKKVTIAPSAVASPVPVFTLEVVRVPRAVPSRAVLLPRSPFLAVPGPLRAPPSASIG
jgi:hypothetical protein